MIRQIFLFLYLLMFLLVQGCSQHHTAPPYHQKPAPQEVIEQPAMQETMERLPARPEDSIVKDISNQANQLMRNGKLDAAAQTLERGLRIAPKDAFLWSQLAAVRLQQRHYGQAQSLAAKSSSLAQKNTTLIHKNQAIIKKAEQQREE
ncbi:MAG: hypothetical protein U9R57_08995 [Thermodesulfobacteriota bacterium]|nr:hypothetical protein [Thermodesulfobacteriota bacterium]